MSEPTGKVSQVPYAKELVCPRHHCHDQVEDIHRFSLYHIVPFPLCGAYHHFASLFFPKPVDLTKHQGGAQHEDEG